VFEKGEMEGITADQMKSFTKSRVNICLEQLGLKPIFHITDMVISDWFYDNINTVQLNDIFTGVGSSYNRNWNEVSFTW
jgi:ribonucleoside-diphosphate reductase beta chain